MVKLKIRKKDKVMVISGRDKGRTGEVLRVFPERMRILVSKINIVSKHKKRTQTEPGSIQKLEAPLAYSKVMLLCPKCQKPVRPKLEAQRDGADIRVCRRCGEQIV